MGDVEHVCVYRFDEAEENGPPFGRSKYNTCVPEAAVWNAGRMVLDRDPEGGSGSKCLVGFDGKLSVILPIQRSGKGVVGHKIISVCPATWPGSFWP